MWLAAGVLLHDVVLSLAVVAVGAVVTRLLPVPVRLPAVVALVVVGSLTLVAVPVLGRFGAKADNPTLLDRPYLGSWLVLLVLTRGRGRRRGGRPGPARPACAPVVR